MSATTDRSSTLSARRARTKGGRMVAGLLIAVALAGCAGSVAPPVVVAAMPAEARAGLRVARVMTEVGQGVAVGAGVAERITQFVLADLQTEVPGLLEPGAARGKTVRIVLHAV